jgi:glycosyltransferase involved in cell wall biosynthesis
MARPVVGFAGGGLPEIVQHDESGWLVEGSGAAPLVAALARARRERDRLPAMGERGRAFVLEQASVDAMCRGYAREYEAACGSL